MHTWLCSYRWVTQLQGPGWRNINLPILPFYTHLWIWCVSRGLQVSWFKKAWLDDWEAHRHQLKLTFSASSQVKHTCIKHLWYVCVCFPRWNHLVVFDGVVAEALPLSEALWDLLCVTIWVDTRVKGQVPLYLCERLRAVHVGLPRRAALLGTVASLVIDRACRRQHWLSGSSKNSRWRLRIGAWAGIKFMMSFIRVNIAASRTASYLWEQTVTWQRARSSAKRGCEAPSRWRTFGSGPGMSHPDDPGPGSKSWWTAPQETQSLLQRFSHQVMQSNCGRRENTKISTAAQEDSISSYNNKYEPMFTKHWT